MNRSAFTVFATMVSFVSGITWVLAPKELGAFYGVDLDRVSSGAAQLLGAAYLGYAVMNWFAKDAVESAAQRAPSARELFGPGVEPGRRTDRRGGWPHQRDGMDDPRDAGELRRGLGYFAFVRPAEVRTAA